MANHAIAADKVEPGQNLLPCEKKGCFVVADRMPWKENKQRQGLRVKSGTFVVTIPSNVMWIGLGSTVTVFRYDSAPHIVIGMETKETFQLTSKEINLSQALEHIFTNTPKDQKISDRYNIELWNRLMLMKMGFLDKSGKAFVFEKAPLTVYFIPDSGEQFNNVAWAVDSGNPNSALRIESNMDEKIFEDILYSIKLKEK